MLALVGPLNTTLVENENIANLTMEHLSKRRVHTESCTIFFAAYASG